MGSRHRFSVLASRLALALQLFIPQTAPSPAFLVCSTMFTTRAVASQFQAREQSEGVGARIHLSVGSHKLRNLDPFLYLADFKVALPGGIPDHPHRGFEAVTYLLPTSKGHILHEDFMGNEGTLRPGDLQWMSAGRGVVHAEMPATQETAHGLQLWINLPKSRKLMEPRYQDISRESVPHVYNDDQKVEAIVFAGEVFGKKGLVETETPVTYVHFIMQPSATLEYRIPQGHNALLYVISGEAMCAGSRVTQYDAVVLDHEGDGVQVVAGEAVGSEFIVVSGQPLNEPIVQYGPFVMTSENDIRDAFFDYQTGKNGFENARAWTSSIAH